MERDRMEENGMRRRADNAFVGWLLVVGLVVVGTALLAVAASRGAAAWPAWGFLGCGVAAVAADGVWGVRFFNRLERGGAGRGGRFPGRGFPPGARLSRSGAAGPWRRGRRRTATPARPRWTRRWRESGRCRSGSAPSPAAPTPSAPARRRSTGCST